MQPNQLVDLAETPRERARFIEQLYAEFRSRGWHTQGAKATWDEAKDKPIPQQGVTLHRVTTEGTAGVDHGLNKGKLTDFYRDSDNVVAPRSYREQREVQALRWISTLVFKYLHHLGNDPMEVQAAVHNGSLLIAANTSRSNNALNELVKSRTGAAFVALIVTEVNRLEKETASLTKKQDRLTFSEREDRHRSKLVARIINATDALADAYPLVRKALTQPVVVCANGVQGLHAERRINMHAGVTPVHISGVKRPCVACYLSLFTGRGVHPGPYWPSDAANIGFAEYQDRDVAALAERITAAITDTYVTLTFACPDYVQAISGQGKTKGLPRPINGVTDEQNSDSDTDDEGEDLVTESTLPVKTLKRKADQISTDEDAMQDDEPVGAEKQAKKARK